MHIGVDARPAIAYRGTGIGTYTTQLLRHLLRIDRFNSYHLLLPGDRWVESSPGVGELLAWCGQKQPDFWEAVGPPETPLPTELAVYLVPQNGLGFPRRAHRPQGGRVRLAVTVHDLIPYVLPQTCSPTFLSRALEDVPQAVAEADIIITVSTHSKRDLQEVLGVPEGRIAVIPEAPDEAFQPLDQDACRLKIRRKYGLAGPFILNVGGFSRRKNLPRLVEAFADLARRTGLPHSLVLVGRPGGGCYAQCQALAARLGLAERVKFPGFVAEGDLPALYNAAELFVFPSLYEGFGLPPLEAMACGIPVVASRASSLPEVVGDAAALVDPLDPAALSQTMETILSRPAERDRLRSAGLRRAAAFSWNRAATLTLLALERAAQGTA
ncbi:MAG: glycosyltransferase family 4 protein [Chitinophagales bacterium]